MTGHEQWSREEWSVCWRARVMATDWCGGRAMRKREYLDVPGGAGGGVGAPQRARDAPRAPHVDCRAAAERALPPLRAHAASLLQATCAPIPSNKSNLNTNLITQNTVKKMAKYPRSTFISTNSPATGGIYLRYLFSRAAVTSPLSCRCS